jgi:hypothetical protein
VGTGRSNRDAIGARVTATIGGQTAVQQITGGSSYLSSPERTLTFGLGGAKRIDALEIRWPDGSLQRLADIPGGSVLVIEEGGQVTGVPTRRDGQPQ